jgi:hypothetical protein
LLAELRLEGGQLLRDSRLAEPELTRRRGERAVPNNSEQSPQVPNFHVISITYVCIREYHLTFCMPEGRIKA